MCLGKCLVIFGTILDTLHFYAFCFKNAHVSKIVPKLKFHFWNYLGHICIFKTEYVKVKSVQDSSKNYQIFGNYLGTVLDTCVSKKQSCGQSRSKIVFSNIRLFWTLFTFTYSVSKMQLCPI
jgi:hypothetical protein